MAAATVDGYAPVPAQHVVHVGGRDFDPGELEGMARDGVTVVPAANIRQQGALAALSPTLQQLRSTVDRIHVHMDLDVLNPAFAPANQYAVPDGLTVEQISEILTEAARHFEIVSAVFSSYDPDYDPEDKTVNAGMALMQTVLELASHNRVTG
jgi:arginase